MSSIHHIVVTALQSHNQLPDLDSIYGVVQGQRKNRTQIQHRVLSSWEEAEDLPGRDCGFTIILEIEIYARSYKREEESGGLKYACASCLLSLFFSLLVPEVQQVSIQ